MSRIVTLPDAPSISVWSRLLMSHGFSSVAQLLESWQAREDALHHRQAEPA